MRYPNCAFQHSVSRSPVLNPVLSRFLLFFCFLFLLQLCCRAQTSGDLSTVRVEELTDEQIKRFIAEADRQSLKDDQIEKFALERGMSPVEVVKLKDRIRAVRKVLRDNRDSTAAGRTGAPATVVRPNGERDTGEAGLPPGGPFGELQDRNFGYSVFHNSRITFEPNLHLPTPKNYLLAADDELSIDVSGYSEANYRLKISPEGLIRIPSAGSVMLNGMTIEQAKKAITNKLANTIYTNIKSGQTSVDVTLGAIRSIKVTVIGEATQPGTYTLPSLASAYNALYACGGPGINGSFRDIQVIRNNKVVATIDVYQYILNGNRKNDVRLMEGDLLKINTYKIRVTLKGEVKKPGEYDVADGESIGQLIRYAGGFTDQAYSARIQVFTNTDRQRKVTTIAESQLDKTIPQRGDSYVVGKILNRFVNRISIKGAVYRPGEYELLPGMTLLQLVNQADGIREDAFTGRAVLHRLRTDLSPEIVSIDLFKLLAGEATDIVLQREDRVEVFSKFDLKEGYYVKVEGEISNPGTFLYEAGMTVQDLILLSGGFKESASNKRIEISRRIAGPGKDSLSKTTAVIYRQDVSPDLRDSAGAAAFTLMPFDEVSIRPAPGYFAQKNAVIEGEVVYSGKYTIETKDERISDLVKRSGGLTPEAYVDGAVLVRTKNFTRTEQNNNEQGLANLLKQNSQAGASSPLLQNQLEAISRRSSEKVGIDLKKILQDPHSEYDLLLNDGDTLRIPKLLQTVRVNGEVLYPALVRFNEDYHFKDYISGAGGFSDRSARRRSYVVYANGSVRGTKSFLFFRNYPSLTPGAEIFVPTKRERERLRAGEVITIGATVVTMLAVLFSIFRNN